MPIRTGNKDDLGPQLGADDTIQFIESRRPGLPAGDYRLQAFHDIDFEAAPLSSKIMEFAVAGPRFGIQPADVLGVFPPAGATGAFNMVLPHILLKRSTVPWERTAYRQDDNDPPIDDEKQPPWLALLVFSQGDLQAGAVKNITIEEARAASTGGLRFPGLAEQTADPAGTSCTVIEVRWEVLQHMMPTATELFDLTHVRAVPATRAEDEDGEQAVVIASRLPKEETHISVHLVSLEGFYLLANNDAQNPTYEFFYRSQGRGARTARPQDRVRLISLYSWSFYCQVSEADNFDELLQHLNEDYTAPARFHLPAGDITEENTRKALASGFVPLRHRFRYGERSVSWYHGPFVPWGSPIPQDVADRLWTQPVRSSDELVLYNEDQGLFDVSYAAAWELGRLLVLKDLRIASRLFDWKRRVAQFGICTALHDECKHLPVQTNPGAAPPPLDREVGDWFEAQLILLEGVPFNYLVPDERLLPPESIRLFDLDPLWLAMLCDGAFSIDRVTEKDAERDLLQRLHLPSTKPMSGFLMRSKLVAGWPDMAIDAYGAAPGNSPFDPNNDRLTPIRKEFLSPTVLLMLFARSIQAVDFYLCPETIHFGVQVAREGINEAFSKKLRGATSPLPVSLPIRRPPNTLPNRQNFRVVDIERLKSQMSTNLGVTSLTPADFAMQMVDGAPLVRLQRNTT